MENVRQGNRERQAGIEADLALRNKREPGAAGTSSARDANVSLMREERLTAENEVKTLLDELDVTRRPQERAELQKQLAAARQRVRAIGDKISRYGDDKRGAGAPRSKPQPMPASKALLRRGELYDTARGPARWNGSAFELEGQ